MPVVSTKNPSKPSPRYKTALNELADIDFLQFAWKDFYRHVPKSKRESSGIDGMSFIKFQNNSKNILQGISIELLGRKIGNEVKRYIHTPLQVFPLEKEGKNSYRIICIPTIKDRLIQKAALQLLINRGYIYETKISYGYSREKSVKNAIKKAKSYREKRPWVLKTDITSFFDNIPRDEMKKCVKRKIRLKSLHPIFYAVIDAEITSNISADIKNIIKEAGINNNKGLRQGLPLSPLLSNIYLEVFDKKLSGSNFFAIRYADDLAIFCTSREECLEAFDFCSNELKNIGLKLPPLGKQSKSVIYNPSDCADFLGLGIVKDKVGYKLQITNPQIEKIWKKFMSFQSLNKNVERNIKFTNLISRLNSMVESYKGHYGEADNYLEFEQNLHKWKRLVVRNIFSQEFDINVEKLNFKQKVFLHLID